jgi:hypothetical protein
MLRIYQSGDLSARAGTDGLFTHQRKKPSRIICGQFKNRFSASFLVAEYGNRIKSDDPTKRNAGQCIVRYSVLWTSEMSPQEKAFSIQKVVNEKTGNDLFHYLYVCSFSNLIYEEMRNIRKFFNWLDTETPVLNDASKRILSDPQLIEKYYDAIKAGKENNGRSTIMIDGDEYLITRVGNYQPK